VRVRHAGAAAAAIAQAITPAYGQQRRYRAVAWEGVSGRAGAAAHNTPVPPHNAAVGSSRWRRAQEPAAARRFSRFPPFLAPRRHAAAAVTGEPW